MGAEDHKRIKGASDKDCGHLEWVQDRIIWLNARRYWIELELKTGTLDEGQRKELFNKGMRIAEEQKGRIDEGEILAVEEQGTNT